MVGDSNTTTASSTTTNTTLISQGTGNTTKAEGAGDFTQNITLGATSSNLVGITQFKSDATYNDLALIALL